MKKTLFTALLMTISINVLVSCNNGAISTTTEETSTTTVISTNIPTSTTIEPYEGLDEISFNVGNDKITFKSTDEYDDICYILTNHNLKKTYHFANPTHEELQYKKTITIEEPVDETLTTTTIPGVTITTVDGVEVIIYERITEENYIKDIYKYDVTVPKNTGEYFYTMSCNKKTTEKEEVIENLNYDNYGVYFKNNIDMTQYYHRFVAPGTLELAYRTDYSLVPYMSYSSQLNEKYILQNIENEEDYNALTEVEKFWTNNFIINNYFYYFLNPIMPGYRGTECIDIYMQKHYPSFRNNWIRNELKPFYSSRFSLTEDYIIFKTKITTNEELFSKYKDMNTPFDSKEIERYQGSYTNCEIWFDYKNTLSYTHIAFESVVIDNVEKTKEEKYYTVTPFEISEEAYNEKKDKFIDSLK